MGTHSSPCRLPHQVGSPPQKVGSYQAEFSMSLLRLYRHHSTDVIKDQRRIFLYMSSSHLPSSSFKKKGIRTRFCNAGPSSPLVGCQAKKSLQNTGKKQTKNKKDPKLRDHCPLFLGDDVMIWMIWKFTHFFGYKREKKWWVSTLWRQHICNHIDNIK